MHSQALDGPKKVEKGKEKRQIEPVLPPGHPLEESVQHRPKSYHSIRKNFLDEGSGFMLPFQR